LGISILLPFIVFTKTIWLQPLATNPNDITNFAIEPLTKAISMDWLSLIFYGYIAGTFLFAIRFVLQLLSLHRLVSRSIKFVDGKFIRVETDQKSSPFSFFRYIVYNPNLHPPSELNTILAHEKVHAERRHSMDIIVMHIFTIFQWCNPFIWWYRACLDDNLEYLADTETIAVNTSKTEYQYLLLRTGMGEKHYSLVTPFFNTSIKKRINMLNQNRSKRKNAIKYTLMLPLLMAFILMFNIKTQAQVKASYPFSIPIIHKTEFQLNTIHPLTSPIGTLQDSIQIVYQIEKGTTDKELSDLADEIAGQGGELKIKELKRNKTGQISNIGVSYKIDDQKIVSGVYSDPSGIALILFGRSKINGQFIVGENEKRDEKIMLYGSPKPNAALNEGPENKDTTTKFRRTYADGRTEENVVRRVYEDGEEKLYLNGIETTKEGLKKVNIYMEGEVSSSKGVQKVVGNTGSTDLESFETKPPLYLLDGKEVSKSYLEKLDPETFESVVVLKDPKVIEKYGDKGKNGVIVAKTKSKWKVGVGLNTSSPEKLTVLEYYRQMEKAAPADNLLPDINKALILVDGVPSSQNELKLITADRIKMLYPVSAGNETAIDKYGDQAKNGVIELVLRKE
jgi:hypothetical protein